jgi:hypothetical protein
MVGLSPAYRSSYLEHTYPPGEGKAELWLVSAALSVASYSQAVAGMRMAALSQHLVGRVVLSPHRPEALYVPPVLESSPASNLNFRRSDSRSRRSTPKASAIAHSTRRLGLPMARSI